MERTKQKSKKDKPNKYVDKEKPPSFMTDVKTLKENLKIREILRTVKMNSSMRIKAPRGSKVMQNKDFAENEDIFEDSTGPDSGISEETTSATNLDVVTNNDSKERDEVDEVVMEPNVEESDIESAEALVSSSGNDDVTVHKSKSLSEGLEKTGEVEPNPEVNLPNIPPMIELLRSRERKLSLDHTMLSRREGLSQSDLDLHSIGKSPLERKSSFFRKKLDSFLKNTTEIFRRQSLNNKGSQTLPRRGSNCSRMSVSLHSLNENATNECEYEALDKYNENESKGSTTSVLSSSTPVRSNSSISINHSERTPLEQSRENNFTGSQTALNSNTTSTSINSLNEVYTQDSLLNSRAISMSSGLDTAHGQRKRKTSRSNRVTWLASEGLTDYFKRMIQDEKSKEMQVSHSYQDFSTIPENYGKTDSKGRRLSYQRAVSGEDPFLPPKYMDTSLRRKKILENPEVLGNNELSASLAEFSRRGVPPLVGYTIRSIPDDALTYLMWAENEQALEDHYDWKKLSPKEEAKQAVIKELLHTEADHIRHLMSIVELSAKEEAKQAVIKELLHTEADHIRHLMSIVEVYIAAAHALQDENKLLNLDTSQLFLNIPDVLNANMMFWELVMYPMVADSFRNNSAFNSDLMAAGFAKFSEIFEPYEDYVCDQSKAVDYLRALSSNAEFMTYLTWCHSRNTVNRLQLADILVKPMQRLTKYSLILRRIIMYTETEESKALLDVMEATVVSFVHRVNRAIRQREEVEKVDDLEKLLDSYEVDFKDEDMDRYFHMLNEVNLKAPMVNCGPDNSRSIIYQGDLRFKDHTKEAKTLAGPNATIITKMNEIEVRVFLFTDIILICKKQTKGSPHSYKIIRPKYMLERTIAFARFNSKTVPYEVTGLIYVVVDELGSAYTAFCLSESAKDPNPQQTLKIWDQKIREARLSYELSVWFYMNPVKDLSEVETDYSSDSYRGTSEEYLIERRARERVAAMMHPNRRGSTCQEITTMRTDSFDRSRGPPSLRNPLYRTSTGGSSRNSRLSSFHQSTSAASHDEPLHILKHLYKAGSSVEHLIPPQNPDDVARSITVNVVSESECETVVPSRQATPPMVLLQESSPRYGGTGGSTATTLSASSVVEGARPSSAGSPTPAAAAVASNTLRVAPHHGLPLVHSLPDLSVSLADEYKNTRPQLPAPSHQTASEKLYQSHQELLLRKRLAASQHHQYLSPDHRGTSYPPPSPTRASLKRGLAFSYSFKNPPLSKMGHVNSQSQVDHASAHARDKPSTSGISEKGEKRKQLMGRSKVSGKSHSPERSNANVTGAGPRGVGAVLHQHEHIDEAHLPLLTHTTTEDHDDKNRKIDKTSEKQKKIQCTKIEKKPDKTKVKDDKHLKKDKGKSE